MKYRNLQPPYVPNSMSDVFKWIFPVGPTYWGQVANNIQYIKNQRKGDLKGALERAHPAIALGDVVQFENVLHDGLSCSSRPWP